MEIIPSFIKRVIVIPDQGTPQESANVTIAVLKAMDEADAAVAKQTPDKQEETFRIIIIGTDKDLKGAFTTLFSMDDKPPESSPTE